MGKDDKKSTGNSVGHPSRNLRSREKGFGIGGGYERTYRRKESRLDRDREVLYGRLPHCGYYGAGIGSRPFKRGEGRFNEELTWYKEQYGETSVTYRREEE